jgi:hypothetical protein
LVPGPRLNSKPGIQDVVTPSGRRGVDHAKKTRQLPSVRAARAATRATYADEPTGVGPLPLRVLGTIALIMALAAAVQAVAVRGYVGVLFSTRNLTAPRRVVLVVLAWLVYAAVTVAPLLVALGQSGVRAAVVDDYAAVALLLVGFLFSLLPAGAYIQRNLPALRRAGYFRRRW